MNRFVAVPVGTVLIAISAVSGCGKSPYETAAVHGMVTIDGQPFSQGKVMFAPIAQAGSVNSGKPAFGQLQPDGSYALSTYGDGDGAVVGEHWVTLIRTGRSASASKRGVPAGVADFSRVTVPQKQSVMAGQDNKIDIAVSAKDIARFGSRHDD